MNLIRVKIGAGCPLSGDFRSMGREMSQAIGMAVADANLAGSSLNLHFELLAADDKSSESAAESVAQQFCANTSLLGVVGHYNSGTSMAAAPVYRASDMAMITPVASNPDLTERGFANVFRFTNRDDRTGAAIAGYLYHERGKRRAAVVESESEYGRSMGRYFAEAFQRQGGNVLVERSVPVGRREFKAILRELPQEFDVLFYGGTFEGSWLLSTMRSSGMSQLFATGDGCWDTRNFLEPAGTSVLRGEGVLVLAATPGIGYVRGASEFVDRYRIRYGPITNYAVNSYDAASALIEAIRGAARKCGGMPPRAEVAQSLRELRHEGIAYRNTTSWNAKGDNEAAVTALYDVVDHHFRMVTVIE